MVAKMAFTLRPIHRLYSIDVSVYMQGQQQQQHAQKYWQQQYKGRNAVHATRQICEVQRPEQITGM
jgi:hypothetical protein